MLKITKGSIKKEVLVPTSRNPFTTKNDINFREKELKEWEIHQRNVIREEYTK